MADAPGEIDVSPANLLQPGGSMSTRLAQEWGVAATPASAADAYSADAYSAAEGTA
jgi:hypothetical protein